MLLIEEQLVFQFFVLVLLLLVVAVRTGTAGADRSAFLFGFGLSGKSGSLQFFLALQRRFVAGLTSGGLK